MVMFVQTAPHIHFQNILNDWTNVLGLFQKGTIVIVDDYYSKDILFVTQFLVENGWISQKETETQKESACFVIARNLAKNQLHTLMNEIRSVHT